MNSPARELPPSDKLSINLPGRKMIALKSKISNRELADRLSFECQGAERDIGQIQKIENNTADGLSFSNHGHAELTPKGTVISKSSNVIHPSASYIFHDDPRLAFVLSLNLLISEGFLTYFRWESHIDSSARIHPSAIIEDGCIISGGSMIGAGAVIKRGTAIGANCVVAENTVLGANGFAYVHDVDGNLLHFPQLSGLSIGNNVTIGANTVISIGSLQHTRIGCYTKINGNVFVGHGVEIGSNVHVNAGAVASGECKLLDKSWIGTNATVLQKMEVSENCIIGSGAVVTKHCNPNATYVGVPAKELTRK